MKKQISYYLGQNGYLRMMTNLSEFTVFFKRENGFISVIELVDMEENPYVTQDIVSDVTRKLTWRFMDQGAEEVHCLTLVLATDEERALVLGEEAYFFWVIDTEHKKLLIPEGKAEDFYGFKGLLETWIAADPYELQEEGIAYGANGQPIRSLKSQPLVNHGIFVINVFVFTFCTLVPDVLYNYGSLSYEGIIQNGEWYRFLTSLFLHGDMSHLVSNMIMLFFLGDIVEKELGHFKYFILYFLAGIAGGAASLYFKYLEIQSGLEAVGSIGASGAVFGMLGGLLWLIIRNKGKLAELTFIKVLFLIFYTLYGGLMSSQVDNAAHFGGVLTGFLAAILLYRKKSGPKKKEEIR